MIWEKEVNSKKSEKKIILTKTDLLSKCIPKCILDITCFFYKHIKIQGSGSDMFKATQYTGEKYAYDMLPADTKTS